MAQNMLLKLRHRPNLQLVSEAAFEHRFAPHVLRVVERMGAQVLQKRFESNVTVLLEVALEENEGVRKALAEVCAGRIEIRALSAS